MKQRHHSIRRYQVFRLGLSALLLAIPLAVVSATVVGNADIGSSVNDNLVGAAGHVSAQSDTTAPAAVNNLTADQPPVPPITPPCGPVTLYPTINAMGVTIASPVGGADHASIRYRVSGTSTWTTGQDAVSINTGAITGSLFWLSPATSYDVEVTSRTTNNAAVLVSQCTATTQADVPSSPTVHVLNVSASAAPGGNGSISQPYNTIQAAVNAAQPGDEVLVQSGTYHEEVIPPHSGLPGQYIKIIGQPGAVMDASDPTIEANGLNWVSDGGPLYHAVLPGNYPNTNNLAQDPAYRDSDHFYTYDNLSGLQNGTDHHGDPMAEGWFFDPATKTVYIRSTTDPATHTWHIRSQYHGFYLEQQNYFWIEGLTFKYFPSAIYIRSASNNIVRQNTFQSRVAVLVDNIDGPMSYNTRIESNNMSDAPVADWGYFAVKGTWMEAAAIEYWNGTGGIIRDNRIENFHDGIFGSGDAETDVYRNVVRHLSDDGLEPDGDGVNYRAWGNGIDNVLSSISLAPINVGPAWIVNNRLSEFHGRAFKIGDGVNGVGFIYQNTIWSDDATNPEGGAFGTQQVSTDTNAFTFRNNIFQTVGHAIRWTAPMPGINMDDDNVYSTNTNPYVWNAGNYFTLSALCSNFGAECHGSQAPPQLIDPANGTFGLAPGSPNIDAGIILPGINDGFTGAAPDRGYVELGQPEISW